MFTLGLTVSRETRETRRKERRNDSEHCVQWIRNGHAHRDRWTCSSKCAQATRKTLIHCNRIMEIVLQAWMNTRKTSYTFKKENRDNGAKKRSHSPRTLEGAQTLVRWTVWMQRKCPFFCLFIAGHKWEVLLMSELAQHFFAHLKDQRFVQLDKEGNVHFCLWLMQDLFARPISDKRQFEGFSSCSDSGESQELGTAPSAHDWTDVRRIHVLASDTSTSKTTPGPSDTQSPHTRSSGVRSFSHRRSLTPPLRTDTTAVRTTPCPALTLATARPHLKPHSSPIRCHDPGPHNPQRLSHFPFTAVASAAFEPLLHSPPNRNGLRQPAVFTATATTALEATMCTGTEPTQYGPLIEHHDRHVAPSPIPSDFRTAHATRLTASSPFSFADLAHVRACLRRPVAILASGYRPSPRP